MNNKNEEIKIDKRIIKTKRAIKNAFTKLLTKKNIDSITIKDIADEAYVNRKTIYNYYNGIYEIQGEIENDLVNSFEEVVKDLDFKTEKDTSIIFDRLNTIINKNIDFYGHLLDMNANSLLVSKIVNSLKTLLKEAFIKQKVFPIEKVDIIVNYIGTGMLGAYQNWFLSGRQQPLEEFSKDIHTLVNKGAEIFKK